MDEEKRDELLAQEYALIQKMYEDLGARALTFKAWSVTFSGAGLGLAYSQSIPILLLIGALSAFVFWIAESLMRSHQKAYLPRIEEVELHFRGGPPTPPFQISRSWWSAYKGKGRVYRTLVAVTSPHIMLPHVVILAAGVLLYIWYPPPAEQGSSALTPPPFATPR